jgi:hypothetical protein
MIDKAIVIASESIEYVRTFFPADDAKYAELVKACADMLLRLKWLKGEMLEVEHENKSRHNDPCICPKCDPEAKQDREFLDKCLKEALVEDLSGVSVIMPLRPKGNPDGKMTLVYDRDKKEEPCPCGKCEEETPTTNELIIAM